MNILLSFKKGNANLQFHFLKVNLYRHDKEETWQACFLYMSGEKNIIIISEKGNKVLTVLVLFIRLVLNMWFSNKHIPNVRIHVCHSAHTRFSKKTCSLTNIVNSEIWWSISNEIIEFLENWIGEVSQTCNTLWQSFLYKKIILLVKNHFLKICLLYVKDESFFFLID